MILRYDLKCSVSSLIRVVSSAICTSGEPVSPLRALVVPNDLRLLRRYQKPFVDISFSKFVNFTPLPFVVHKFSSLSRFRGQFVGRTPAATSRTAASTLLRRYLAQAHETARIEYVDRLHLPDRNSRGRDHPTAPARRPAAPSRPASARAAPGAQRPAEQAGQHAGVHRLPLRAPADHCVRTSKAPARKSAQSGEMGPAAEPPRRCPRRDNGCRSLAASHREAQTIDSRPLQFELGDFDLPRLRSGSPSLRARTRYRGRPLLDRAEAGRQLLDPPTKHWASHGLSDIPDHHGSRSIILPSASPVRGRHPQ